MDKRDRAMCEYDTVDLLHIVKSVWRYAWAIVLAGLAAAVIGCCIAAFLIAPKYSSSVMLYVNNNSFSVGSTDFTISSSQISAAQSLVDTYSEILDNRTTLERVIEKTGVPYEYEELSDMITAGSANGTEIMKVTVVSEDPYEAAEIANAIAEILPVRISEIIEGASMEIVDTAVPDLQKIAPSITKYAAVALILGVMISCGIVAVLAIMDDTIHDENYILQTYPYPILAKIPNLFEKDADPCGRIHDRLKKNKTPKSFLPIHDNGRLLYKNLDFMATEQYKLLRTNLDFTLPSDEACPVIGVTSSIRHEGKSTTSINLSYVLAEKGNRVLLIDGDLRLPSVAKKMELDQKKGLTDFLMGDKTDMEDFRSSLCDHWYVMTAGTIPPNPSELLGSSKMAALLAEFRKSFDYIVIDLPPVNVVSDAVSVAGYLTGMIVVAREEYIEKKDLKVCFRQLSLSGVKILGCVISFAKRSYGSYGKYARSKHDCYYANDEKHGKTNGSLGRD